MHPEGVLLIATVSVVIGIVIVQRRGEKLRLPIATLALAFVTLVTGVLVLIDPTMVLVLGRDYGAIMWGEWWRFATSIFAQEPTWFPIAFNLIALVVIGGLFESAFGWRMLLVTFFAAGLFAEVVGFLAVPSGYTGNSIANNGLAGMLAVVALTLPLPARALGVLSIAAAVFLYARGLFVYAFADLHAYGYFVGVAIGVVYLVVRWARARPSGSPTASVPA
jgi:membrane associated rhomboid family serine protease